MKEEACEVFFLIKIGEENNFCLDSETLTVAITENLEFQSQSNRGLGTMILIYENHKILTKKKV